RTTEPGRTDGFGLASCVVSALDSRGGVVGAVATVFSSSCTVPASASAGGALAGSASGALTGSTCGALASATAGAAAGGAAVAGGDPRSEAATNCGRGFSWRHSYAAAPAPASRAAATPR